MSTVPEYLIAPGTARQAPSPGAAHRFPRRSGLRGPEDAAHSFGSRLGEGRVGASGDLTCFSFGPIKNLTCGQGGAVVPRTRTDADTIRRIRLLDIAQSQAERAQTTGYSVTGFGLRYQMSGINAAIGLAQLAQFERTEAARRALWHTYRHALAPLDRVTLIDVGPDRCVPHLCQVRVPGRDTVFAQLKARGIGVGVHYPPTSSPLSPGGGATCPPPSTLPGRS
ncbi:DegT/DnrJ/EryC1/StrS family aminotransferase [Streptomyces sp. NPDC054950]